MLKGIIVTTSDRLAKSSALNAIVDLIHPINHQPNHKKQPLCSSSNINEVTEKSSAGLGAIISKTSNNLAKLITKHQKCIIFYKDAETSRIETLKKDASLKSISQINVENLNAGEFLILEFDYERHKDLAHIIIDCRLDENQELLGNHLKSFESNGGDFRFAQTANKSLEIIDQTLTFCGWKYRVSSFQHCLLCDKNNETIYSVKLHREKGTESLLNSICTISASKNAREELEKKICFFFNKSANIKVSESVISFDVRFEDIEHFYHSWAELQNFVVRHQESCETEELKRFLGLKGLSLQLEVDEQSKYRLALKDCSRKDIAIFIAQFYKENSNILLEESKLVFYDFAEFLKFLNKIKDKKCTFTTRTNDYGQPTQCNQKIIEFNQACESDLKLELHNQDALIDSSSITGILSLLPKWIDYRKESENRVAIPIPMNSFLFNLRIDFLYAAYIAWYIKEKIEGIDPSVSSNEGKACITINSTTNPSESILSTHITPAEGGGSTFPHYRHTFCEYLSQVTEYKDVIQVLKTDRNDYRICVVPQYNKQVDEHVKLIKKFLITLENFTKVHDAIKSSADSEIDLSSNLGYHVISPTLSFSHVKDKYVVKFDLSALIDLRTKKLDPTTQKQVNSKGQVLKAQINCSNNQTLTIDNNTIEVALDDIVEESKTEEILPHLKNLKITAETVSETVIPIEDREKTIKRSMFDNFSAYWSGKLQTVRNKTSFNWGIKNKLIIVGGVIGGVTLLCLFVSVINNLPSPFNGIVGSGLVAVGVVFAGICYKKSQNNQNECQKS